MNHLGYNLDNFHDGDVRITGDLEVDGKIDAKGGIDIEGDITIDGDIIVEAPGCVKTSCVQAVNNTDNLTLKTNSGFNSVVIDEATGDTDIQKVKTDVIDSLTGDMTISTSLANNLYLSSGIVDMTPSNGVVASEIRLNAIRNQLGGPGDINIEAQASANVSTNQQYGLFTTGASVKMYAPGNDAVLNSTLFDTPLVQTKKIQNVGLNALVIENQTVGQNLIIQNVGGGIIDMDPLNGQVKIPKIRSDFMIADQPGTNLILYNNAGNNLVELDNSDDKVKISNAYKMPNVLGATNTVLASNGIDELQFASIVGVNDVNAVQRFFELSPTDPFGQAIQAINTVSASANNQWRNLLVSSITSHTNFSDPNDFRGFPGYLHKTFDRPDITNYLGYYSSLVQAPTAAYAVPLSKDNTGGATQHFPLVSYGSGLFQTDANKQYKELFCRITFRTAFTVVSEVRVFADYAGTTLPGTSSNAWLTEDSNRKLIFRSYNDGVNSLYEGNMACDNFDNRYGMTSVIINLNLSRWSGGSLDKRIIVQFNYLGDNDPVPTNVKGFMGFELARLDLFATYYTNTVGTVVPVASIDHNLLQSLGTGDPHNQYHPSDGSRALTGPLNVASFDIQNVATINGLPYVPSLGGDFKADGSVPMTGNIQMGENNIVDIRQIISSTSNNNKIILNNGVDDAFAIGDNSNARFSFNSGGFNTVTRLRGPAGPLNFDVDNNQVSIQNGNFEFNNNNINNLNNLDANSIQNASGDLLINDSSGAERIRISASGTNRVRIGQSTDLMVENITPFNAGGNALDIKQSGFSGTLIIARFEDSTTDSRFRTIRPLADNLYNIGTATERYGNIYVQNINPTSTGLPLQVSNSTDKVHINTDEIRFNQAVVSSSYTPQTTYRVISDASIAVGDVLTQSLTTDFRVVPIQAGDPDDTCVIGIAKTAAVGAGVEIIMSGGIVMVCSSDNISAPSRRDAVEKSDTQIGKIQDTLSSPGTFGCAAQNAAVSSTVIVWGKYNEAF